MKNFRRGSLDDDEDGRQILKTGAKLLKVE